MTVLDNAAPRDPLAAAAPPRDPDHLTADQLTVRLRAAIAREHYSDLASQLYQAHRTREHAEQAHRAALRVIEAERVQNRRLRSKVEQVQRRLDTRDAANHRALLDETPTAVLLAELGRRATAPTTSED